MIAAPQRFEQREMLYHNLTKIGFGLSKDNIFKPVGRLQAPHES